MPGSPFKSFFMGGFECSTHRDNRGRRLDLIGSTRHDEFAEADYARLCEIGIETARDGLRWHLIEKEPGKYDFSSARNQILAARKTGIQIVWDYFHYGYPDDLDILSEEFLERFSLFAGATTEFLKNELGDDLVVCPVNEISFFSWIAGSVGVFYPCLRRGGDQLKGQLVKAALQSVRAIRDVCPTVRIMWTDPAIHVVPKDKSPGAKRAAESYRRAQFHAFDMLCGKASPELGGRPRHLDIVGLNYYFHNQWRHPSRRKIPLGHKEYRPLREILAEYYERYERPMTIAETGIEDDERPAWFQYVCEEAAATRKARIPLQGLCLYPIANHPGWADNRHCHNGLWDYADDLGNREIYLPLAEELRRQQSSFGG